MRFLDTSQGYPSSITTAKNIIRAVESGTDLLAAYDEFMDELAEYLSAKYTPRTAAEQADTIEAGVMYELTEKAIEHEWPYITLPYRDEAFIKRFGNAAQSIVAKQEAQAAADRKMLEGLDMTVDEYMQAATNALKDMLGYARD